MLCARISAFRKGQGICCISVQLEEKNKTAGKKSGYFEFIPNIFHFQV
jgi:hypothetical protein